MELCELLRVWFVLLSVKPWGLRKHVGKAFLWHNSLLPCLLQFLVHIVAEPLKVRSYLHCTLTATVIYQILWWYIEKELATANSLVLGHKDNPQFSLCSCTERSSPLNSSLPEKLPLQSYDALSTWTIQCSLQGPHLWLSLAPTYYQNELVWWWHDLDTHMLHTFKCHVLNGYWFLLLTSEKLFHFLDYWLSRVDTFELLISQENCPR